MLIKKIYHFIRHPFDLHPRVQRHVSKIERLGNQYGGFFIDTARLRQGMSAYLFGIGMDISFDVELCTQIGGGPRICLRSNT